MPRRTRAHDSTRQQHLAPAPVEALAPHPDAWRTALMAAGGDARRCMTLPDGAVLTLNRDVRELPADHWSRRAVR